MVELINRIRYYHFITGVLAHQQSDPLCSKCKAFVNTSERVKEGITELEGLHVEKFHILPGEFLGLLEETRDSLELINLPGDAVGQKKAGICRMPEGVCFIKLPKAILERV